MKQSSTATHYSKLQQKSFAYSTHSKQPFSNYSMALEIKPTNSMFSCYYPSQVSQMSSSRTIASSFTSLESAAKLMIIVWKLSDSYLGTTIESHFTRSTD